MALMNVVTCSPLSASDNNGELRLCQTSFGLSESLECGVVTRQRYQNRHFMKS